MNSVPLIAVKPGSYSPKPTMPTPATNADAEAVTNVARAPTQPQASVHEHDQHIQQTASQVQADISKFIQANQRQMRVSKDTVSGYMVVQLVDPNTGQVIRTLPNDEVLRLARTFEMAGNTMVHQKA
jgi:flagellar protein FlaG